MEKNISQMGWKGLNSGERSGRQVVTAVLPRNAARFPPLVVQSHCESTQKYPAEYQQPKLHSGKLT